MDTQATDEQRGAPPEADSQGEGGPTAEALVGGLRELGAEISTNEDAAVGFMIERGQLLTMLKAVAGRTWGKRLSDLGLCPRVASRLMAVGKWADEIGPIESDLLARLPQDPHKLEWIVQLKPEPLRKFVENLDCRAKPRATVIKEVKKALGRAPAEPSEVESTQKAIMNLLERLAKLVGGLNNLPAGHDSKERVLNALKTTVEHLESSPGLAAEELSSAPPGS